jgi:hypothetical protein
MDADDLRFGEPGLAHVDSFRGRASDSTYLWWHLVSTRHDGDEIAAGPNGIGPIMRPVISVAG